MSGFTTPIPVSSGRRPRPHPERLADPRRPVLPPRLTGVIQPLMAASDAPADVDAETSGSGGCRNNLMEERDHDLDDPPESDGSANDRLDDAETCAAVAEVTGEPCGNPAILGTGRCHMHLDYTELPAANTASDTPPARESPASTDRPHIRDSTQTL